MRCVLAFALLLCVNSIFCEDDIVGDEAALVDPPRAVRPIPIGVLYLIRLVSQPEISREDSPNEIPVDNYYKPKEEESRLLLALAPIEPPKLNNREKRSPGGGGCGKCGGGGYGGGGYPGGGLGGGGHGGGGGGGGYAQSGSWSQASAGSFGSGGGYGKGK